ncbi:MAG TPA: hypothetical protein VJL37_02095 [Flavobacterium sp.]|nr:hypothetical protein [Flavobacterium sp.]
MGEKIKLPLIFGLSQVSTQVDSCGGINDTYSKNKATRSTVQLEYELE